MFHVYGVQGRVFAGSLDELRRVPALRAAAGARRVASGAVDPDAARSGNSPGPGARVAAAYGAGSPSVTREPLTEVAEVMSRPVLSVAADATVAEAWQTLVARGVGQAPVTAADGSLVGLVGRAELLPAAQLVVAASDPAAWRALLDQPVSAVMWSPVPCTLPHTDLRQAAALLLATGLPGVPVTDTSGQLQGFVSRSDLLRAIATDPPLNLYA
jgi:CBS domain-containing protein